MKEITNFEEYLDEKSKLVDEEIQRTISTWVDVPNLTEGVLYALGLDVQERKKRGKRLRPALCLLACESLGGDLRKAMPFAIACELLHNFLLVHDDIEDEDVRRRGRESVWVRYGKAHGINIGDYMFAKTYESVLRCGKVDLDKEKVLALVSLITETINHTGEGQALDIGARRRKDLSVEDYLHIVMEKTGHYLSVPIKGGVIIADAPQRILRPIEEFGKCIGPVFQIADDILDLTESKGRGERGSDIKEGKRSFLVVYTASQCSSAEKEKMFEILDKERERTRRKEVDWVIGLFRKYHAIEKGKEKARQLLEAGKNSIKDLPSPLRENLQLAAEFTLERRI